MVREDFKNLVWVADSKHEERSWHYLSLTSETILLANWYRSPSSIHDGFTCLQEELAAHSAGATSVIITGDLNIHHQRWLKYSRENSIIGAEMKTLCDFHGLTQLVKEPTRKEYLLDLAITDIGGSTVKVLPCIADHNALLVKIPRPAIEEEEIQREVWLLKQAKWKIMKKELASIDWGCLRQGIAEDALNQFHEILWMILIKNIPRRAIKCKKVLTHG